MATFRIELTIEYDPSIYFDGEDETSCQWFFEEALAPKQLVLHSNEMGDSIGNVVGARVTDV